MKQMQFNTVMVKAAVGRSPGTATVQMSGSMFYCNKSGGIFDVKFGDGVKIPWDAGFKLHDAAAPFEKVMFYNNSANDIAISFFIGNGSVDFVGAAYSQVAATYAKASVKVLPAVSGAWIQIETGDAGHRRKQLLITLDSTAGAGAAVILPAGDFHVFCQVTVGSPLIFETDDAFQGYGTGAAVGKNLYVGELYYS